MFIKHFNTLQDENEHAAVDSEHVGVEYKIIYFIYFIRYTRINQLQIGQVKSRFNSVNICDAFF